MKCIIIDDEPIARKGMKRLVDSRNELELLASFGNAETAEEFLEDNDVDLIFLDIEMPEINGIEFAGRIPRKCLVIFTTAYSEYALDSYEVEAIDYLVKPIDPARFNRAVDKAISYHALLDSASVSAGEPAVDVADHIIVKADRRYVKINLDDIVYIEGLKDYVIIHLPEKRVVTRLTLKGIEEVIPHPDSSASTNHTSSAATELTLSTATMFLSGILRFPSVHHIVKLSYPLF